MNEPLLTLRGVRVGGAAAVSLEVRRGEAVALVGPGGGGKRWILRVAAGLREATQGEATRRARQVGYVFRDGGLVSNMSVVENVALPLRYAGFPGALARARSVLESFDLGETAELRPGRLAPEARRLVQLARAITVDADLLVIEDLFTPLSPSLAEDVAAWLRGHLAAGSFGVLMSCPADEDAARVAARVVEVAA